MSLPEYLGLLATLLLCTAFLAPKEGKDGAAAATLALLIGIAAAVVAVAQSAGA